MDQSQLDSFSARYVSMWHEPDPQRRAEIVRGLWREDAENVTRKFVVRGLDEITARVTHAHEEWVASKGFVFEPTGNSDCHHNVVSKSQARSRGARRHLSPVATAVRYTARHVHDDPGRAESDASHERTLQSEQLVEYRGDAHSVSCGFGSTQTTKYHGFPVRFLLPLTEWVTLHASRYVRLSTH